MTDQSKISGIGQNILGQLYEQDPARAEVATHLFQLISRHASTGFAPSEALEAKLRELPTYSPEELEDEVLSLGLEVLDAVLTYDEKLSPSKPEPTVNPNRVIDYLANTNPFFQRWLEFRAQRPAPGPESWDGFAMRGVSKEDQDYARAMRELGQMLFSLLQQNRQIAEYIATGLMNSHLLKGDDRYMNTVAWVYMAEEDAEK